MSEIKANPNVVPFEVLVRAQELVQRDGLTTDKALELAKDEATKAQTGGEPPKPPAQSYLNEYRRIIRESEPKK